MQVGRDETIAEVRLMKVRDFLRWAGDCSVQFDAIKERFGCDEARAEQIGEALIDAGYLEDDPNETKPGKWYVVGALEQCQVRTPHNPARGGDARSGAA